MDERTPNDISDPDQCVSLPSLFSPCKSYRGTFYVIFISLSGLHDEQWPKFIHMGRVVVAKNWPKGLDCIEFRSGNVCASSEVSI